MTTDALDVTDVTDVTEVPYNAHTRTCAHGVYQENELHRLHRLRLIDGQSAGAGR